MTKYKQLGRESVYFISQLYVAAHEFGEVKAGARSNFSYPLPLAEWKDGMQIYLLTLLSPTYIAEEPKPRE